MQDSGNYACVGEVSGVSVTSNVARLTVYGGYIQECRDENGHVPDRKLCNTYSEYKKTWRALPTTLFYNTLTSDHLAVIEHTRCKMEPVSEGLHRTYTTY